MVEGGSYGVGGILGCQLEQHGDSGDNFTIRECTNNGNVDGCHSYGQVAVDEAVEWKVLLVIVLKAESRCLDLLRTIKKFYLEWERNMKMKKHILIFMLLVVVLLLGACKKDKVKDGEEYSSTTMNEDVSENDEDIVGYYSNTMYEYINVSEDGTFVMYTWEDTVNGTYEEWDDNSWLFITSDNKQHMVQRDSYGYGFFMQDEESEKRLFYRIKEEDFDMAMEKIGDTLLDCYSYNAWERVVENDLFDFSVLNGQYSYIDENGNQMGFEISGANCEGLTIKFENAQLQQDGLASVECKFSYSSGEYNPDGTIKGLNTDTDQSIEGNYGITYQGEAGMALIRTIENGISVFEIMDESLDNESGVEEMGYPPAEEYDKIILNDNRFYLCKKYIRGFDVNTVVYGIYDCEKSKWALEFLELPYGDGDNIPFNNLGCGVFSYGYLDNVGNTQVCFLSADKGSYFRYNLECSQKEVNFIDGKAFVLLREEMKSVNGRIAPTSKLYIMSTTGELEEISLTGFEEDNSFYWNEVGLSADDNQIYARSFRNYISGEAREYIYVYFYEEEDFLVIDYPEYTERLATYIGEGADNSYMSLVGDRLRLDGLKGDDGNRYYAEFDLDGKVVTGATLSN